MKSGIYIYCNLVNGRKYIGQSVNMLNRVAVHLSESKNEDSPDLSIEKAIRKYGKEKFHIIKIEYPVEMLDRMEEYYINFFDTFKGDGYNCSGGGKVMRGENHAMYGKKLPKEWREKIGKAGIGRKHSEETKEKMRIASKGRKLSEETKRKISESKKNISEETRRKMSESQKGRIISLETRKKMSMSKLGNKNNRYGISPSVETRRKISEAAIMRRKKK